MILYPFPNLHWWKKFLSNPTIISQSSDIRYKKNQAYNKYSIVNSNGLLDLSIPIMNGRNQRIPFHEVRISYTEDWQKKHWRTLTSAYNNSPYFEYFSHHLAPLFENKIEFLHEFNSMAFDKILEIIRFDQSKISYVDYDTLSESDLKDFEFYFINKNFNFQHKSYHQVFSDKNEFIMNTSILDVIFNEGKNFSQFLK